jgi:hypothetical protein
MKQLSVLISSHWAKKSGWTLDREVVGKRERVKVGGRCI